ncbi:MAG: RNA polymerase sigma-70 factor [Bacteroidales bacterium]|nr:RNA polymerase sigma-70 factor [Bacteroidales bacterium]
MHEKKNLVNESDLVIRLINGDEKAFCELYAAYKERLLYFALKFVKSREFAEDIFQDVFTTIWQTRRSIDPYSSFSSYLYTIFKNRVLNQLRDKSKEEQVKAKILSQAVDYTYNTTNQILSNELKELIRRAVEQLTPRQRKIFEMSRNGLMSHQEIADTLNISVNTVQEHISSALKTIRSSLTKYSDYADLIILLVCINI